MLLSTGRKLPFADLSVVIVAERLEVDVGGIKAGMDHLDHLFGHIAIGHKDIIKTLFLCQLSNLESILKKYGGLCVGIGDAR